METSSDLVDCLINENENLICAICLDNYLYGREKMTIFFCGHQTCDLCGIEMLKMEREKYNCPFCNFECTPDQVMIVNVDKRMNQAFLELKRKENNQKNSFESKLKENEEEKKRMEEERNKIQEELNRLKESLKRKEEEILEHQRIIESKKNIDKAVSTPSPSKTETIIKTSKNVFKEYMGQVSNTFWRYAPMATDLISKAFQRKVTKKLEKKEEDFLFLEKRGISKDSNLWKAISKEEDKNQHYAIKRIKQENNQQNIRSIFREAMILETLNSFGVPGVVQLSCLFHKNKNTYYVYPYCEFDLEYLLAAGLTKGHELSISMQLISTVYFIHKEGLAHRDLKPHSVLLNFIDHEKGFEVKLGSWSYCGSVKRGNANLPDLAKEYHRYRSPEYFYKKRNELNYRAGDVWALGCILGELVLNEPVNKCWNNNEADYLISIFENRECRPSNNERDLPKMVQKALDDSISSSSLLEKLKDNIPNTFAEYIVSFLTYDENREIKLEMDLFPENFKIPIFDIKEIDDEYIEEWVQKNLSKNFVC